MPNYRKKPVVIDAFQWTGANPFQLGEWRAQWPRTFSDMRLCVMEDGAERVGELEIMTLEDGVDRRAKHVASPGDWIIRGVQGEFYACKPDIFALTYENAELQSGAPEGEPVAWMLTGGASRQRIAVDFDRKSLQDYDDTRKEGTPEGVIEPLYRSSLPVATATLPEKYPRKDWGDVNAKRSIVLLSYAGRDFEVDQLIDAVWQEARAVSGASSLDTATHAAPRGKEDTP